MRFVVVAVVALWAVDAAAYAVRVGQVPNGPVYTCGLCHVSPRGGGPRTVFGNDVRRTQSGLNANWPAVCPLDSDGDGFTNGQELEDPDCVWTRGVAVPGMPTNPNDPDEFPEPTPDAAVPDAAVDAALPDVGVDAALPDAALPDALGPDAALPDAAQPDAALPDAAPRADSTPTPGASSSEGGCRAAPGGTWGVGLLWLGLLRRRKPCR